MLNIARIVAFLALYTAVVAYAFDAFGQTPTHDTAQGPLGTSDVVFVYGSQVPGDAPHVTTGPTPPTRIVFLAPVMIYGKVPRNVAPIRHRGTLNHASTVVRNVHRVSASFTSMDLPGAPQDFAAHDACEIIGPRLDGSKVRICGGTVVAVIDTDGTVHADPFTPGLD